MIKYAAVLYSLSLLGCAAALVPESNSPRTKINQASSLFNDLGRPLAAAKLLKQAIPLAQSQNDRESEADAEFYLAEIHKNPGERGAVLKKPDEAIQHYKRAIALYNDLKLYKRSSFVSWNASAAYEMKNDKNGQCASLREAEKSHQRTGGESRDILPQPYSDGNLLKSIQQLLKENKC